MSTETNKAISMEVLEKGFNQGDLSVIDKYTAPDGIDHQEPPGTDIIAHIKDVILGMRTAFPDLHFEVHQMIAEGEIVAFRSTMTGTHLGVFNIGPIRGLAPTGRKISVPHMHFVRMVNGKTYDLWHVWDIPSMMRQLGIAPEPQRRST